MLRLATAADLVRLAALRDSAGDDALSDPSLMSDAMLARLIAAGTVTVWDDAGAVAGFAVVDAAAIHLLVGTAQRNRGVGRALLAAACAAVKGAGHAKATVSLPAAGAAERHYRAAGWRDAGLSAAGGLVLKKPL